MIGFAIISCSEPKTTQHPNPYQIENWKIELQNRSSVLPGVKGKIPEAEFSLQFINKNDSSCIKPILAFYTIKQQNTIEKELMNYLVLRSSLYPAFYKIYHSEHYVIIRRDLKDNFNRTCCNCESLITQLEKMYHLQEKSKTFNSL